MKTSVNIKPCNIGSSEAHNRRTPEYLAHIGKESFYVRTDLMAGNEAWVAPDFGATTLSERYNQIAAMVKEKTGRAMQTKDRERVNKKTGKMIVERGSTPLKEGVVVIKDDTSMEQLQHFCAVCRERWGISALQIFIHRDEGHYGIPGDAATWKPNLHAHIVWDWMNHDTGKSCKLDDKDMSEMQTLLSECLAMERGSSKELTGKEHLERADFILAKQRQEAEQVKAEKRAAEAVRDAVIRETDEARDEYEGLQIGYEEKQRRSAELDSEIADKEERARQVDRENTSSIKSGLANLLGKGKYAEIERENARLQNEVEAANADRDKALVKVGKMEEQVAQIPRLAEERALIIIERKEAQHEIEVRKLRQQHNDHVLSLRSEYDKLSKEYRSLESSSDSTIKRLEREKSDLLARIKAMLDLLNEALREVVRVVVEFSRSVLREFSMRHREAVVGYLSTAPDVRGAANSIKVFARPFLDDRQFDKGSKELDRLTSNFPSVLKEVNRTQNRGFKL